MSLSVAVHTAVSCFEQSTGFQALWHAYFPTVNSLLSTDAAKVFLELHALLAEPWGFLGNMTSDNSVQRTIGGWLLAGTRCPWCIIARSVGR